MSLPSFIGVSNECDAVMLFALLKTLKTIGFVPFCLLVTIGFQIGAKATGHYLVHSGVHLI